MTIHVNGATISDQAIAGEIQHHPAGSLADAEREAKSALVVRELLLQEADRLDIEAEPVLIAEGKRETRIDARIRALIAREVVTPDADEASCRRYYENNRQRFITPTLYEAAHIFFPADPRDGAAREAATTAAKRALEVLAEDPGAFARLARELSACSSASEGGRLGQVSRGETLPEFETYLEAMEPGQICPLPVATRYGLHVVRLDHRAEGRVLPFEKVHERIAGYLGESVRRRALAQYIAILAGRARIDGFDMAGAPSPLVQ